MPCVGCFIIGSKKSISIQALVDVRECLEMFMADFVLLWCGNVQRTCRPVDQRTYNLSQVIGSSVKVAVNK